MNYLSDITKISLCYHVSHVSVMDGEEHEVLGCVGEEEDGGGGLWWQTRVKEVVACDGDEVQCMVHVCVWHRLRNRCLCIEEFDTSYDTGVVCVVFFFNFCLKFNCIIFLN